MAKNKEEKTNVMRVLEQKKIAYTAPAMVVLMSALVFKEKITGKKLLALALALLG